MKTNESNGEIYDESAVNNIMEEIYKEVNSHSEKIIQIQTKIENIQEKVEDLSSIKETLIELKVLQKEQAKFNVSVSETLGKINDNLNILNNETKDTSDRVASLENKVDKIDGRSKFDFLIYVKESVIPILISGGIIYYISQYIK